MLSGLNLLWLIGIFSIASSTIVNITNEQYELMQFARDVAILNHILPTKIIKIL